VRGCAGRAGWGRGSQSRSLPRFPPCRPRSRWALGRWLRTQVFAILIFNVMSPETTAWLKSSRTVCRWRWATAFVWICERTSRGLFHRGIHRERNERRLQARRAGASPPTRQPERTVLLISAAVLRSRVCVQVPTRINHKFQLAYRKWPFGEPDQLDGWHIALVDAPADAQEAGYSAVGGLSSEWIVIDSDGRDRFGHKGAQNSSLLLPIPTSTFVLAHALSHPNRRDCDSGSRSELAAFAQINQAGAYGEKSAPGGRAG
jgi:hypothetical protein